MASDMAKSTKFMKRTDSMKSHSWWWDSHISPKNSKWLSENLEEMDQSVKRMLKLIEQDADSFRKKAEMYYQKRPQLISHVEEFYRMYRSLAERYDQVTGELRKNIPSDLQSQGSAISEISSEPASISPSPDQRPKHHKRSNPKPAGVDAFLNFSGSSSSDLGNKEGEDESSTLDSEFDSDNSSVNNYNDDQDLLAKKIANLETELFQVKDSYEGEITSLKIKLDKYRSGTEVYTEPDPEGEITSLKIKLDKYRSGTEVYTEPDPEVLKFEEEMRRMKEKLDNSEREIENLRHELGNSQAKIRCLQEQFGSANKDNVEWKSKLEREQREVLKLHDRIARFKSNLSDRDHEIRELKESINNANKTLSEENSKLSSDITKSKKEKALLEDVVKELDLKCQSMEDEMQCVKVEKLEIEELFREEMDGINSKMAKLVDEVNMKDYEIEDMKEILKKVDIEHGELVWRIGELEEEIEKHKETILEGGESKREAIRQLCLLIEHYRIGYRELQQGLHFLRNK